jgi:heme o synthase
VTSQASLAAALTPRAPAADLDAIARPAAEQTFEEPLALGPRDGSDPGALPASARTRRVIVDLLALTKPRITAMVAITMIGGVALSARAHGTTPFHLTALVAVAGTLLVVAGANALNMYLERDSDRLMLRTRDRPLPAGRLSPDVALVFGLSLSMLAIPLLTFGVNATTGLLAALALVSYVLAYTPLKRKTTASLLIGAVPGAIPPLIGWTAVSNRVEAPGLLLFAVLFLWQVPHFLAIATFRRDEYVRAGLKILPVERGDRVTRWHIVGYSVLLVAASLLLVAVGVGGRIYLGAASALGLGFLGLALGGLRPSAGRAWARLLFFASIVYLTLLLAALVVSP